MKQRSRHIRSQSRMKSSGVHNDKHVYITFSLFLEAHADYRGRGGEGGMGMGGGQNGLRTGLYKALRSFSTIFKSSCELVPDVLCALDLSLWFLWGLTCQSMSFFCCFAGEGLGLVRRNGNMKL